MTQPTNILSESKVHMGGIYGIPGEGFVVELHQDGNAALYDRQGLQYRILQRKQAGLDTQCEEKALSHINNLRPGVDGW